MVNKIRKGKVCAIQIGGVSMIIHYFYIYLTTNCCLGIVTCYKLNCSCCLVLVTYYKLNCSCCLVLVTCYKPNCS